MLRLKFHQFYLTNILIIVAIIFVSSALVSYFTIKENELKNIQNDLLQKIQLVEMTLKENSNFQEIAIEIYQKTNIRFTLINNDGVVIAESNEDPKNLNNHLLRPEIVMASNKLFGQKIRHSDTTQQDFLYVAKKISLKNDNKYIRLAIDLDRINQNIFALWFKGFFIFAIAIIVGLSISYYVNKRVGVEIRSILGMLKRVSKKEYQIDEESFIINEFYIISQRIIKMAKKLNKIDKLKRGYDAKIRLKNKQQKDIISALSHEFKNPIAIIHGYSETLATDKDMNKMTQDRFLEKIFKNAQKLNSMINKFTLAIKLEDENFKITKTKFNLSTTVLDIISNLKDKYPNRNIIANIQNNIIIYADSTLLEIVVSNLIDNSLKYSNKDVILDLNNTKFCITDSGVGISAEDLKKITKKFYRVDNQNWNNSMGLGLFIVEYILHLHNFSFEIESTPKIGSKFSFSF